MSDVRRHIGGAIVFGLLGLGLGSVVASVIGKAIAAIYHFETAWAEINYWVGIFVFMLIIAAGIWWFSFSVGERCALSSKVPHSGTDPELLTCSA